MFLLCVSTTVLLADNPDSTIPESVKIANAIIINREYVTLMQAQIVAQCPKVYSSTPSIPKKFEFMPVPGEVDLSAILESKFGSNVFAKRTILDKPLRIKPDANYKSGILGQAQKVRDCLLQIYEGRVEDKVAACEKLQTLHYVVLSEPALTALVNQALSYYVDKDGNPSIFALVNLEKTAFFIVQLVKEADNFLGKSKLINPELYKQIKHYEMPEHVKRDLFFCLFSYKNYDFANAITLLALHEEERIFFDVLAWYELEYENQLKKAQAALYGTNGILLVAKDDPVYRYCVTTSVFNQATSVQKHNVNANFLFRHHIKTIMHEKWDISKKVTEFVHDAMYMIMGADCSTFTDISILQQQIENLVKAAPANERDALINAFYLPNGILKEYTQFFTDVKMIEMPEKILTPLYDKVRKQLNDLMCEQVKVPEKAMEIHAAREHLRNWFAAKSPKEAIEAKDQFNKAYTNIFNTYPGGVPYLFSIQDSNQKAVPASVLAEFFQEQAIVEGKLSNNPSQ